MSIELTAYELELLKVALPYAQKLKEEDKTLTRDDLRRHLSCGKDAASRIRQFIKDQNAVKLAEHRNALPGRAEDRAVVDFAIGENSGTGYSHVLRENLRLKRQIARMKFDSEAGTAAREQQIQEELNALKEVGRTQAKVYPKIERSKEMTGNLLEINIPDAHFGKLAWGVETGGRPYDVKIAIEMYKRAARSLINRATSSGVCFDKILYVVGNDILNANDSENKTAHGTIVTTDGRYHKTFRKLRETIQEIIEELRLIAPVDVYVVYGNHDTLSAWHLGDSLECAFAKCDDVLIQNTPTYRKYFEYGKCMILLTHGDKAQRSDYPLLMAHEQPEMWARTMHREAHTGHYHNTKLEEYHGVRVRILPALCPADDWHAENGYVGALRNAEAYWWNAVQGIMAIFMYNDDSQDAIVTQREVVPPSIKQKK
jgi:predicted phosphodiesterase